MARTRRWDALYEVKIELSTVALYSAGHIVRVSDIVRVESFGTIQTPSIVAGFYIVRVPGIVRVNFRDTYPHYIGPPTVYVYSPCTASAVLTCSSGTARKDSSWRKLPQKTLTYVRVMRV